MRLVDADVLRRELIKGHDLIGAKYVDLAPDIDAVEVVRCRDCMWWLDSDHTCHEHSLTSPMAANEFCSRAERRSDGID